MFLIHTHLLVHPNLVAHQRPQTPAATLCHKLGHTLGSYSARLSADDVAALPGCQVLLEDELRHLGGLTTSCGSLDHCQTKKQPQQ